MENVQAILSGSQCSNGAVCGPQLNSEDGFPEEHIRTDRALTPHATLTSYTLSADGAMRLVYLGKLCSGNLPFLWRCCFQDIYLLMCPTVVSVTEMLKKGLCYSGIDEHFVSVITFTGRNGGVPPPVETLFSVFPFIKANCCLILPPSYNEISVCFMYPRLHCPATGNRCQHRKIWTSGNEWQSTKTTVLVMFTAKRLLLFVCACCNTLQCTRSRHWKFRRSI